MLLVVVLSLMRVVLQEVVVVRIGVVMVME